MLTSLLDDICDSVGYTPTRILSVWYAGRTLCVPAYARDDHPLARLIGLPALRALVADFGGQYLSIPAEARDGNLQRDRRIAEALCAGKSAGDVAAEVGLTLRRVEQIRAELTARGWIAWAAAGRRKGTSAPARDVAGTAVAATA